jgi:colanic acid biosynthesis glycosyl transferase WcaI
MKARSSFSSNPGDFNVYGHPSHSQPTATPGKPHRWLILTQYYAPEIGAPQIRLRCLVKELRAHGKDVSVLTAMPNYPAGKVFDAYRGRWFHREKIDGVEIRRSWVYAATGRAFTARFLNYCSFSISALALALFGRRPDVLFVEAQPLPLGIVALFMRYVRGVPYIYNVPDLQVDVAREMGFISRPSLLRLAAKLETLLLKHAWKVSTVTHGFMEHFESRGVPAADITFLPNGADTDFLRPQEPSAEFLDKWNLRGKKVFVYAGTHAFYHGLDTLIEAAEILKAHDDIRVVMVGDGPERERLRQLAKDKRLNNVIFGSASYEQTAEFYSIAYAAVATLRDLPVATGMRLSKVFPALSCGVPVIYSGAGEAAELLVENRCGIRTPPENAASLATAMRALADDPPHRDALGLNGRDVVQANYSWWSIVENWLEQLDRSTQTRFAFAEKRTNTATAAAK